MSRWLSIFALVVFLATVSGSEEEEGKKDVFVATEEWQEIKEGQKVPAGLHYRINMETGKKEAKLLDPQDQKKATGNAGENVGGVVVSQVDDAAEDEAATAAMDEAQVKAAKERMGKVKLSKDVEQIKELMANFRNASEDRMVAILDDLDYYMHQIDNARDFVSLRGLESVVVPALRGVVGDGVAVSANVSMMASMLLGSAVQANQPVKNHAMKIGVIDVVLANLERKTESTSVAIDLKSKTVFALSSLLRQNSEGVDIFVNALGLERLLQHVMNFRENASSTGNSSLTSLARLKVKCLSFVAHLLTEHRGQVEAAWREEAAEWCQAVNDPDLYKQFDLGRIEVMSQVLNATTAAPASGGGCRLEDAASAWLKEAYGVIKSEIEDEDDLDFLEYLKNILENIARVMDNNLYWTRKVEL